MATRKYWSVLTKEGKKRLANATLSGDTVGISHMAVGDGGGISPEPHESQIALVNEQYRARLNRLEITDVGEGLIRAELIIPSQVGGFSLREAALYSEDGMCLAVSNLPETYKPLLSEGAGRMVAVNIWLRISNTENVQLIVDPAIMLATIGELNKAIASAVREGWENDNPVGTVKFYAQNIDPNLRYPWSKWVYTGEDKAIRVGSQGGFDVGQTGGSDTVTLKKENLPSITLDISGKAKETENTKLETEAAGQHNHTSDHRFNKLSARASDIDNKYTSASMDELEPENEYRVGGMAGKWDAATMIDAESHTHELKLPGHAHSVTGKTEKLGEGKSFNVVSAHIRLMCWARVA